MLHVVRSGFGMARIIFTKLVICLGLTSLTVFAFILLRSIMTNCNPTLGARIKQLQALNARLHSTIEELSLLKGGVTAVITEGTTIFHDGTEEHSREPDGKVSTCETVHVGFVAAGYNASRSVVTVLKSILFHRHTPLHFHFVSDAPARLILDAVMRSWNLPAVEFSFYEAEALTANVSWIPTIHYSGVYGLLKLVVPEAFPSTVEGIILLDTDVMVTVDIAFLWQFFETLKKQGKLIGIIENQSNWYLGSLWEGHHPWPALGRGFNTGVVVLNLVAMRERGWQQMWNTAFIDNKHYGPTALADQDIVNAVIKEHPDIHLVLPCAWNVQLGDNALSEFCYQDAKDFKIIHWNSPRKVNIENNHGPYFRTLYQTFLEYNGNLLRRELLGCRTSIPTQQIGKSMNKNNHDPCSSFREAANTKHRSHPFFMGNVYLSSSKHDVTLVSQLSIDRLSMLNPLCHHWTGPMSISVYVSDVDCLKLLNYYQSSTCLKQRDNIALHILFSHGGFYPVNALRNLAIENSRTPYIFLLDIDFLPMHHLYEYLQEVAKVLGSQTRAFVVPAFETHQYKFEFPSNKTNLIHMLDAKSLTSFRYHEWPQGHRPTNFDHWATASTPYQVKWATDFEPYVMVRMTDSLPMYDTRFVGFGWNKVSHIMELDYAGFEFVVLPDAFIIHMLHSPSLDISNFRSSSQYRDCLLVLKKEFQQDLKEKYKS